MIIRIYQVLTYILFCSWQRVAPWKYFQLNAPQFNEQRGIFSKLDTDQLIPDCWRLPQHLDIGGGYPTRYPVFVKPEWGQNSFGIQRADTPEELDKIRKHRDNSNSNYLIQYAAKEKREFEVFVIPSTTEGEYPSTLSVTETINSDSCRYPINGIYNADTHYWDITSHLDSEQTMALWKNLKQIGNFRLARFGLRADSIEAMVRGDFHVIEVNFLYPMPLMLLSNNRTWQEKHRFSLQAMWSLAKITKTIPDDQPRKSIFFTKLKLAHKLKFTHKMEHGNERA